MKLKNWDEISMNEIIPIKDKRWELYEYICKNPKLTTYELSKRMNWTTRKVDYYIKKLLKGGLLKDSTNIVNGRVNKTYTPRDWKEMINWDEMTNTKRPKGY